MENNRGSLEEKKLKLEINELKRPWYKKSSNIITLSIAAITFGLTYYTGLIDIEKAKLIADKKKLISDITKVKTEIKEIKTEKRHLQESLKVFKYSVESSKRKEIEYKTKYKEYQIRDMLYIQGLRDKNKKDEIIKYYKSKLDSIMKIKIFNETFDETFQ